MINIYKKLNPLVFFIILLIWMGIRAQTLPTLEDIKGKKVREDLQELASEKYQGREAGLTGGKMAGDYILQKINKPGLLPLSGDTNRTAESGYVQKFQIIGTLSAEVGASLRVQLEDSSYNAIRDKDYFYFFNSAVKIDLDGPVVFAGYAISAPEYRYDDFQGVNVNGKVIVAFYGEPLEKDSLVFFNGTHQTKYMMEYWKAKNIAARGGKALLVIPTPENRQSYERFLQRRQSQKAHKNFVLKGDSTVPVIYLSPEFSDKLFDGWIPNNFKTTVQKIHDESQKPDTTTISWERGGFPQIKTCLSINYDNPEIRNCRNILAILPGNDEILGKEYILVGSHYDHEGIRNGKLYPGADDNASGVAANLNVAFAFSQLKKNQYPSRSVIFAFWDAEEEGTLGTRYFADHPPVSLQNIKVAINMDMIGRDASFNFAALRNPIRDEDAENKVMLFYSAQAEGLKKIAEEANVASHLHLLFDPNVFFTSGSDHVNFHSLGIPVVYYFTGFHPDKIDYEKLTRIARHIADFTYLLANSSQIPDFDTDILTAPEGDFTR